MPVHEKGLQTDWNKARVPGVDGNKVLESPHPVNPAGFTIHSAVHEVRHDAGCVLHTHTKAGIAVSAQADGLLPISQTSLFPYVTLGYHDYDRRDSSYRD